jgi:hypothetical protein
MAEGWKEAREARLEFPQFTAEAFGEFLALLTAATYKSSVTNTVPVLSLATMKMVGSPTQTEPPSFLSIVRSFHAAALSEPGRA